MPNSSNLALGRHLRAHRESRGITLDVLVASTKIKRSLLADLERNDLSRLPAGIYGRAIIREYAKAIDFPAQGILEQWRLSEIAEPATVAVSAEGQDGSSDFRLTLADSPTPTRGLLYTRVAGALGTMSLVCLTGYVATLLTGSSYWTATCIVALIWYPVGAVLGEGALFRMLRHARRRSRWLRPRARGTKRRRSATGQYDKPPLAESLISESVAETGAVPMGSSYLH